MRTLEDLEAKVWKDPLGGCWTWMGRLDAGGYGEYGRHDVAHRFAWACVHGAIPEGMQVLHRCDVRSCCNPAHLFLGTHQDNMEDMLRKGRNSQPPLHEGDDHWLARVSDEDVIAIRRRYAQGGTSYRELAEEYGVTLGCIAHYIKGRTRRSALARIRAEAIASERHAAYQARLVEAAV